MNEALVDCERINEWLQSRTGRARTACSINLSLNFRVEEIRRTDLREHVHVSDVDQHRGGVLKSAIAICCGCNRRFVARSVAVFANQASW